MPRPPRPASTLSALSSDATDIKEGQDHPCIVQSHAITPPMNDSSEAHFGNQIKTFPSVSFTVICECGAHTKLIFEKLKLTDMSANTVMEPLTIPIL